VTPSADNVDASVQCPEKAINGVGLGE